ncbi:ATP-binding protein [Pseudoalteromonas sp. SS15]|uniref:GAF domain-containing hybrid sensor histidine kinase/response regulator n=1 Tax=Pseudoalteromonas sp. SS15 TaxID=3139393 RepID=UPI003BAD818B
MKSAPLATNEKLRIKTLERYEVLDTAAEQCFDDITKLASVICNAPISLVSLVDNNRQWFKSKVGLDADETSREIAFCSHAILEDHIFEIEDARNDERFFDNPLVTDGPKIRFYAGAPLLAPNGEAIGTLCAISNEPHKLTDEQRLALQTLAKQVIAQLELRLKIKQLKETNHAKDEFLSTISHELRTPLNAITGFSEILKESADIKALPKKQYEFIENIEFSSHQLLEIVNSVLDLEKIDAGKMELKPQPVSLDKLFQSIMNMMASKAQQGEIELNYDIDSGLVTRFFDVDKTKLTQIIVNIIGNAIKFTPQSKQVNVRFYLNKDKLHIEVADQGIGISKTDQALLFDKFKQVGMHRKEGTGLGLCISKGLVELMNGRIQLSSTLGKGTLVSISLPVDECEQCTEPEPIEAKSFEKLHICVVEDNPLNQMLIKAMLQQLGGQYTIFETAEALFEMSSLNTFDIFLLDINLPGMSGLQALEKLNDLQCQQPKVAVTADIFQEKELSSLFDSVITKPYKKSDLIDVLNQLVTSPLPL